jgi:hypothetical protein
MKRKKKDQLDMSEIRRIAEYYDRQSDGAGAKEIERAFGISDGVWIEVPEKLLPQVRKLIARYKKSA